MTAIDSDHSLGLTKLAFADRGHTKANCQAKPTRRRNKTLLFPHCSLIYLKDEALASGKERRQKMPNGQSISVAGRN
jgi:hypothetical protein